MTEVQQILAFIRAEEAKFRRAAQGFKSSGIQDSHDRMAAAASALGETARRIEKGQHHTVDVPTLPPCVTREFECPGETPRSESDRDFSWED